MKKVIMAALVGLLAFALGGCFESTKEQKVKEITLNSTSTIGVKVGDVMTLTVSVKDEDGKVMEGQTATFYSAKKVGTEYPTAVTLAGAQFKPTEAADYKLYAKIGDVKSNEILVTVAPAVTDVAPVARLYNPGFNASSYPTRPIVIITLKSTTGSTVYTFDCSTAAMEYSTAQTITAGTYKVTWQAKNAQSGVFATSDANLVNGNTDPTVYGYVTEQTLTFAANKKYNILYESYQTTDTVAAKKFTATEATY